MNKESNKSNNNANGAEGAVITDFDFSMIADFFRRVSRQGPGGEWETRLATSLLPEFKPADITIADIGCGTGSQTFVLADEYSGAVIHAVDLLPDMIESVRRQSEEKGGIDRIHSVQASMDCLPFAPGSLDLIWAEGSIFVMGYENGLKYWRQFLKPGGFVAVTDCSWLSGERPADMSWINDNLPEIDSIANKIAQMEAVGYEPFAHFALPEECWTTNYYEPMRPAMDEFLRDHGNSADARAFVGRLKEEMAYYEANKSAFGYVFYIGRKKFIW